MKVSKFMIVVILFATILCNYSCKKGDPGEDGIAGTAGTAGANGTNGANGANGAAGAKGATGPQGPAGVAGNANVTQYTYQTATFTSYKDYLMTNMTQGKIDSSLILAYFMPNSSTAWFPIGGPSLSASFSTAYYITRSDLMSCYFSVYILTADNTAYYGRPVTFTKFRIIVATASSIFKVARQGQPPLDVTDYESVRQYYNLPE